MQFIEATSRFSAMFAVSAMVLIARPAAADNIVVTIRTAGQVAPLFLSDPVQGQGICDQDPSATCVYGVESFANFTSQQAASGFMTNFNTGQTNFTAAKSISGVYSGQITRVPTNQYGGAQGSAAYPAALGAQSYSLALTPHGVPGANYFGIWITAMDATNLLRLHNQNGSTFDFTPNSLKPYFASAASPQAYNGNPTASFKGQNSNETYVYVNFYNTDGYFSSVDFTNSSSSGFESSNHAVGFFSPLTIPGTRVLTQQSVSVPEPGSALLVLTGLLGLRMMRRRRGRPTQTIPTSRG